MNKTHHHILTSIKNSKKIINIEGINNMYLRNKIPNNKINIRVVRLSSKYRFLYILLDRFSSYHQINKVKT